MECEVCNSMIPDDVETCPYCHSKVKKKTKVVRRKQDKIIIVGIVLILIFSVFRIGTQIISRLNFKNHYEVESDEDIIEFSSLEELTLMYENVDYSQIEKVDYALQEAMLNISNDVYVNYSVELENEAVIKNFQMTYCLTDDNNREWNLYYNNDHGLPNLNGNIDYSDANIKDLIQADLITDFTGALYQQPISRTELSNLINNDGDNESIHYQENGIHFEAEVLEDYLTISIYKS